MTKIKYCECGNLRPQDGKEGCIRCRELNRRWDTDHLVGVPEVPTKPYIKSGPSILHLADGQQWKFAIAHSKDRVREESNTGIAELDWPDV